MPAGMIARLDLDARRAHRRSAEPSRRRPTRRRAPRLRLIARRTCLGASRLFGTSHQNGFSTPSAASARRSAGNPPPSVLPECAMTATFTAVAPFGGSGARPCGTRRRGRATLRFRRRSPPPTSSGWCMPRYMREIATNATIATAKRPDNAAKRAVRETGSEQEREAAVDRDRSRRVTRRVAGVDRQVLQTNNAGPMRMDDERRGAVGRRLDAKRRRRRTPRSATSATPGRRSRASRR